MPLLLTPREFRLIEGLRINPRKSYGGRVRGERLTKKKGISIEFADFREYSDGDDLRHLDWNVLARLETPVMRTYQDEEDLAVHLLIDASPSMDFGEPSKIDTARQLASSLSYIALNGGDAVIPRAIGLRRADSRAVRGRASYPRLADWLNNLAPAETARESLSAGLRAFAASSARTGIVLLISDGLDPDAAAAIRILGGRGHEVWFLQVLSPIEIDPDLEGDLRLTDGEGGPLREITANGTVLREYRNRLTAHNLALSEATRRVGGRYAQVLAGAALDDLIRDPLKRQGWVR